MPVAFRVLGFRMWFQRHFYTPRQLLDKRQKSLNARDLRMALILSRFGGMGRSEIPRKIKFACKLFWRTHDVLEAKRDATAPKHIDVGVYGLIEMTSL